MRYFTCEEFFGHRQILNDAHRMFALPARVLEDPVQAFR
jgi:hypothetical protein